MGSLSDAVMSGAELKPSAPFLNARQDKEDTLPTQKLGNSIPKFQDVRNGKRLKKCGAVQGSMVEYCKRKKASKFRLVGIA